MVTLKVDTYIYICILKAHLYIYRGKTMEATKRIEGNGLFHTPKDWDELSAKIEQLNPDEKQIAWLFSMFTWNLAAKITNESEGLTNE